MDAQYALRTTAWLEECQVAPEVFAPVLPRLPTFLKPCVDTCPGHAPRAQAQTDVQGLRSAVERQNVAAIASHGGHERLGWQGWSGWGAWDEAP